jgi:hypothetical protein
MRRGGLLQSRGSTADEAPARYVRAASFTRRFILKRPDNAAIPSAMRNAVARGWSVIPVGRNKKPLLSGWKRYQTKRATLEEIADWQSELSPDAWAVVTGSISDLVVLDFDGETGRRTLEKLGHPPNLTRQVGLWCYVNATFDDMNFMNQVLSNDGPVARRLGSGHAGFMHSKTATEELFAVKKGDSSVEALRIE